jgi:DNA-directed RNA polymerase subunit RPC12/RpoP
MGIVDEIKCPHCGAPIAFEPGEILATCKYCGFTIVIETGQTFSYEHSLLLNKYDPMQVEEQVRSWMREGFLKPSDLAKKSKITEKQLVYLPFWVVSVEAKSSYKGIFERITPAVTKEGIIEKEYDWLVLARKGTEFPIRDYVVPLEGKIVYDFRRIEAFAQIFNGEVDKADAEEQAKAEIEANHRFLAQQDVDKIIEIKTEMKIEETVYLHAPLWFIKYDYRGKVYQLIVDGATGSVIKGDIPAKGFGIL